MEICLSTVKHVLLWLCESRGQLAGQVHHSYLAGNIWGFVKGVPHNIRAVLMFNYETKSIHFLCSRICWDSASTDGGEWTVFSCGIGTHAIKQAEGGHTKHHSTEESVFVWSSLRSYHACAKKSISLERNMLFMSWKINLRNIRRNKVFVSCCTASYVLVSLVDFCGTGTCQAFGCISGASATLISSSFVSLEDYQWDQISSTYWGWHSLVPSGESWLSCQSGASRFDSWSSTDDFWYYP